jgi:hypothetical protein
VDENIISDHYLKDMKKGGVQRITVGFGRTEPDEASGGMTLSKGGKFTAFDSFASNLLEGPDEHAGNDIFLRRR